MRAHAMWSACNVPLSSALTVMLKHLPSPHCAPAPLSSKSSALVSLTTPLEFTVETEKRVTLRRVCDATSEDA